MDALAKTGRRGPVLDMGLVVNELAKIRPHGLVLGMKQPRNLV